MLIFLVLIIVNLILLVSFKSVQVSETAYQCRNGVCEVSFQLRNRTPKKMSASITIMAFEQVSGQSPKVFKNEIVGELNFLCELGPRETRKIVREIKTSSLTPHLISVKAQRLPQ